MTRTPEALPDDPSRYTGNLTLGSLTGPWVGPARCLSDHTTPNPPIPYGADNANQNLSQLVESGYKRVRGLLTEGRYLTFETMGGALTNMGGCSVGLSPATESHDNIRQRWIIHATGDLNEFFLQSAKDKKYLAGLPHIGILTKDVQKAQPIIISYNAQGSNYTLSLGQRSNTFVSVKSQTSMFTTRSPLAWDGDLGWFEIFSVSYS